MTWQTTRDGDQWPNNNINNEVQWPDNIDNNNNNDQLTRGDNLMIIITTCTINKNIKIWE